MVEKKTRRILNSRKAIISLLKILIFIPARGGSKGIPGKNLVELNGKPLIQYTLETTLDLITNKTIEWIPFISTDDEKIATFCRNQGFNLEYKRPKELSGDKSPMMEAIWDALKWLEQNKNLTPNAVLLLQPTSPLRKETEIIKAIKQAENEEDFSIVSVTRMREHPFECIETNENGWSFLSKPDNKSPGRQGYNDNFFFIDGSFYFASIGFLIKNKTFLIEDKTQFHILNQLWPIDIDDQEDLAVAEFFLR